MFGRIFDAAMTLPDVPFREWYGHVKRAIETEEVEPVADKNPPQ